VWLVQVEYVVCGHLQNLWSMYSRMAWYSCFATPKFEFENLLPTTCSTKDRIGIGRNKRGRSVPQVNGGVWAGSIVSWFPSPGGLGLEGRWQGRLRHARYLSSLKDFFESCGHQCYLD
jgi:hypothetical protein